MIVPAVPLSSLESLYRLKYAEFLRLAIGFLGDHELAHDAVQESFARAIRQRERLRNESALTPWLLRTLTNLCIDWHRHRGVRREADGLVASEPGSEVVGFSDLRAVIAALPDQQRAVIFLRHYADLDYQGIADVLGIERGTVAATLHQAHSRLRQVLMEANQ